MDTWVWIAIAAAVVVVVLLAIWTAARKRRRSQLREGFGPEYDRTVEDMGSRRKAEADVSVDHPDVVQNYRAANEITERADADTEEQRQGLVHYRALFDELLETEPANR